ncbi:MAG TPA: potassium/proton antiporter [Edaphocola sp.]|nr:potassium/proton antiporter [Edaphocola sp.]
MSLSIENILFIGSVLLLISIFLSKTSTRLGVPALILFLSIGMLSGSEGVGNINFDNPTVAQFIGVVSLNFILFSGGLDTDWKAVKPILYQGLTLSTLGVLLTAITLGGFVYWITDFSFFESMLLGSIVSSTDAAAVFSILRSRSIALKDNIRPTLEFESGSNDPMAYVLTILFLSLVLNPEQGIVSILPLFFQQMILGAIGGLIFGWVSKYVINKVNLGFQGLYPVLVIALMFINFSFLDYIGGNGFLSIYVCAVYLGSQELIHKKTILQMFDGLAWLMQIVLFLTLGLLIFPSQLIPFFSVGLLISLFLIFVARPVSVFLSLIFFKMSIKRRLYISWVGLRGAVPIVFATYPLLAGIEKSNVIFNIVFFISLTSVLLQGTTLAIIAKWLKVALPLEEKKVLKVDYLNIDFKKSDMREYKISPNINVINKRLVDLKFPETAVIAVIKRNGQYFRPNGSSVIEENDVLMIMANQTDDFIEVEKCLEKI